MNSAEERDMEAVEKREGRGTLEGEGKRGKRVCGGCWNGRGAKSK